MRDLRRAVAAVALMTLFQACAPERDIDAQAVRAAAVRQMESYPAGTFQDLYKSFFQDRFGAGHLISDPAAAADYISEEAAVDDIFGGEIAEPAGWRGQFVRVNLSLVRDGALSAGTLADALLRSTADMPEVREWRREWGSIERIILREYPAMRSQRTERRAIRRMFRRGEYAMHHSDAYNAAYGRHYRLISASIWESELLPLLGDAVE